MFNVEDITMKALNLNELDDVFSLYWSSLQNEFFKLETLQTYSVDDEKEILQKYNSGNYNETRSLINKLFVSQSGFYTSAKERNIAILRVHIVEIPFSSYLNYELEVYKIAEQYGENIFLINKDFVKNTLSLPIAPQDFLLFDGRSIILNRFNVEGCYVNSEISESSDEIQPYVKLKDILLKNSLPLVDFLKTLL